MKVFGFGLLIAIMLVLLTIVNGLPAYVAETNRMLMYWMIILLGAFGLYLSFKD